jgi:hypothetical protein
MSISLSTIASVFGNNFYGTGVSNPYNLNSYRGLRVLYSSGNPVTTSFINLPTGSISLSSFTNTACVSFGTQNNALGYVYNATYYANTANNSGGHGGGPGGSSGGY